MRSSHFKILSTVSAWPTRISLKSRLLSQKESVKHLQHILLGSGERLYAEWLFARDSHHLSHRISSAISQSLHTCRPIRKHCMCCRNLQEYFIIFHINLSSFVQYNLDLARISAVCSIAWPALLKYSVTTSAIARYVCEWSCHMISAEMNHLSHVTFIEGNWRKGVCDGFCAE